MPDSEGVAELVREGVSVADCEGEAEAVREAVADTDSEAEAVAEGEGVFAPQKLAPGAEFV